MDRRAAAVAQYYVIRIYRRNRRDTSRAEGVVEGTAGERLKVFHNAEELLEGLELTPPWAVCNRRKTQERTGGQDERSKQDEEPR